MLADLKIMRTFAPAIERESIGRKIIKIIGALVQLVRIHACHAWGHGFESRTHRNIQFCQYILAVIVHRVNAKVQFISNLLAQKAS